MKALLPLLFLSLLQQGALQDSEPACPDEEIEPLISGPRYRVHEQFFSSDLSSTTAHESRLGDGEDWCSPAATGSQHWLQVTFGTNVTIHTIQTAGADGFFSDSFVTSFQVHVGSSTSSLQPVMAENSSTPMVFERNETPAREDTVLPFPVTTQILRIVVLTWSPMDDDLCLDFEALGCLTEPICKDFSELSADRDILTFINASSEMSDDPAEDALDRGSNAWCTLEEFMEGPRPYLLVKFANSVALSHMEARGGTFGLSYVTGFRLEVQQESGNFTAYGITDEPTIFTTDTSGLVLYTFWRPAIGETFRFNIVDGVRHFFNDDFCWNIRLYGCFSNGSKSHMAAPVIELPTEPETEPETTTEPLTTPTDLTTGGRGSNGTDLTTGGRGSNGTDDGTSTSTGSSNFAAIIGAVVGVSMLFMMVLGVTLTLCCLYYCILRSDEDNSDQGPTSNDTTEESVPTYHKFDNAIYGEEIEKSPPATPIEMERMPSLPTNTYESLPASLPGQQEEELQYDYADTTVVRVRVPGGGDSSGGNKQAPKKPDREGLLTQGFDVSQQSCEGQDVKAQREDRMQRNPSYKASSIISGGAPPPAADAGIVESLAANPLYGDN